MYKSKDKQREYQREWMASRRREYTAGRECATCGTVENLNWHHVDPQQKVEHKIWSWSRARLEAELAKCITLCVSCHQRHHHPRTAECGTKNTKNYDTHGCRCDKCRKAKALRSREYRERKKRESRDRAERTRLWLIAERDAEYGK